MNYIEDVLEYLRYTMRKKKISFQELADAFNMKVGTLRNKFSQKRLTVEDLCNICEAMDLSLMIKDNSTNNITFNFNNPEDLPRKVIPMTKGQMVDEVMEPSIGNIKKPRIEKITDILDEGNEIIESRIKFQEINRESSVLKSMSKSRQAKIAMLQSNMITIDSPNFDYIQLYGSDNSIVYAALEDFYAKQDFDFIFELINLTVMEDNYDCICQPSDEKLKKMLNDRENIARIKFAYKVFEDPEAPVNRYLYDEIITVINKYDRLSILSAGEN